MNECGSTGWANCAGRSLLFCGICIFPRVLQVCYRHRQHQILRRPQGRHERQQILLHCFTVKYSTRIRVAAPRCASHNPSDGGAMSAQRWPRQAQIFAPPRQKTRNSIVVYHSIIDSTRNIRHACSKHDQSSAGLGQRSAGNFAGCMRK